MAVLAPSIVSADLGGFSGSLLAVAPYAARWHVDVMDGHYVPNLTIGPMFVKAIAAFSDLPQDVHLMVSNPDATWQWYAESGARRIAFHPDTSDDPAGLLGRIAEAGIGPGLAVNPDVSPDEIKPFLGLVDHLVVMSVFPGFSGQSFIPSALDTLRRLRSWVGEAGSSIDLIVDGGVNLETAPRCLEAGADVLVSASAIFGADDPPGVAEQLAALAAQA